MAIIARRPALPQPSLAHEDIDRASITVPKVGYSLPAARTDRAQIGLPDRERRQSRDVRVLEVFEECDQDEQDCVVIAVEQASLGGAEDRRQISGLAFSDPRSD